MNGSQFDRLLGVCCFWEVKETGKKNLLASWDPKLLLPTPPLELSC